MHGTARAVGSTSCVCFRWYHWRESGPLYDPWWCICARGTIFTAKVAAGRVMIVIPYEERPRMTLSQSSLMHVRSRGASDLGLLMMRSSRGGGRCVRNMAITCARGTICTATVAVGRGTVVLSYEERPRMAPSQSSLLHVRGVLLMVISYRGIWSCVRSMAVCMRQRHRVHD